MAHVNPVNQDWLHQEKESSGNYEENGYNVFALEDGANRLLLGPPWDNTGRLCVHHHTHYLGDYIKVSNIKMPWTVLCPQAIWQYPCLVCETKAQLSVQYPDLDLKRLNPKHVVRMNFIRVGKEDEGWYVLARGGGTLKLWNWLKGQLDPATGSPNLVNPYSCPVIKVTKSGSGFSGTKYDCTFEPGELRPLHYDQQKLEHLLNTIPNLDVVFQPPDERLTDLIQQLCNFLPTYYTKALSKGQSQVPSNYQPSPQAPQNQYAHNTQQPPYPPPPAGGGTQQAPYPANTQPAPTQPSRTVPQPPPPVVVGGGVPPQHTQPPPQPTPQHAPQSTMPPGGQQVAPPPGCTGPMLVPGLSPGQKRPCYGFFHTTGNKTCVHCPDEEACKVQTHGS